MSISYAAVARSGTIIATYSPDGTNLLREVQKLLESPFVKNEQKRMNRFLFTLSRAHQLAFVCATDVEGDKQLPIEFLDTVITRWPFAIGELANNASPHSLSGQARPLFEAALADSTKGKTTAEKIRRDFEQTQQMVSDSVQIAIERGVNLNDLSTKSQDFVLTSEDFKNEAIKLKRKMFLSWLKSTGFLILVILLVVYIVLAIICGGLSLKPRCL